MSQRLRIVFGSLSLLAALVPLQPFGWSQISSSGSVSSPSIRNPHQSPNEDDLNPMSASLHEKYAKLQSVDRQRHIVSDTERLLYLTNRLKTEITDSGSGTLSPDMVHEMDEIEKLARNVKNRMRN